MIDREVDLFDEVARKVLEVSPGAYVSSQHVSAPPQFPAVSVVESSNVEYEPSRDSSCDEKYSAVTYEVNVYSASRDDPKSECRVIVEAVSAHMRMRNMTRTYCGPVDNAADPSIYRIVARYTGVIDKSGTMYERR